MARGQLDLAAVNEVAAGDRGPRTRQGGGRDDAGERSGRRRMGQWRGVNTRGVSLALRLSAEQHGAVLAIEVLLLQNELLQQRPDALSEREYFLLDEVHVA